MVSKSNEDRDKVEIILEAAQKRFGHYGLLKTTMNEIAEDIGMSKASLYYYFPDKEKLFCSVIEKELNEFVEEINKLIAQPKKASQLLIEYVQKRYLFFRRFINLAKLRSDSIKNVKPLFSHLLEAFKKKEVMLIEEIIQLGIQNNEFENKDSQELAELFVMLMLGLRTAMLKRKSAELLDDEDYSTLEKHLTHLTQIFIKGITITK